MQEPLLPVDEAIRIKTLRELNLLDTPAEERFDRLARITQHIFDVPSVLITLIDSDRQWLKSAIGVEIRETPRSISFCGHTILERNILVVSDTHLDHRFSDNPLVINAPHIRFYAGRPICATNGKALGTLCLVDSKPRHLEPDEASLLNDLAEQELLITIRLEPEVIEFREFLALFYLEIGQPHKAAEQFEHILEIDPDNEGAREFLEQIVKEKALKQKKLPSIGGQ